MALTIVIPVGLLIYSIIDDFRSATLLDEDSSLDFLPIVLIWCIVWKILLWDEFSPKHWNRAIISDQGIIAYKLLGSQICEISFDQPIYYAILHYTGDKNANLKILMVSNEPFEIQLADNESKKNRRETFVRHTHDPFRQIPVYYNKRIQKMFPKTDWIEVLYSRASDAYY